MVCACMWACFTWCVTFDPSQAFPWAWEVVKGDAESVNEAEYICWNLLAAGPRVRRRGRGVCVVV